jgi:hypothetical protein
VGWLDGRASWNGRPYVRAEMGTARVSRVVGEIEVAGGDTLSYQVLRPETDPRPWLSVEAWPSGFAR